MAAAQRLICCSGDDTDNATCNSNNSKAMKVNSLGLLLLLSNVAAEQSWFHKRVAGLGGSLQRFLEGDTTKCEAVTVNFDTDADGTALAPPLCVDKQWEELGLTFFAEGGAGKLPCLFDTANPGSEENGGDADLGAPNEGCSPSGPGIGEGGAPREPDENCESLGNVLIIQEKGIDVPDDNVAAASSLWTFQTPAVSMSTRLVFLILTMQPLLW